MQIETSVRTRSSGGDRSCKQMKRSGGGDADGKGSLKLQIAALEVGIGSFPGWVAVRWVGVVVPGTSSSMGLRVVDMKVTCRIHTRHGLMIVFVPTLGLRLDSTWAVLVGMVLLEESSLVVDVAGRALSLGLRDKAGLKKISIATAVVVLEVEAESQSADVPSKLNRRMTF